MYYETNCLQFWTYVRRLAPVCGNGMYVTKEKYKHRSDSVKEDIVSAQKDNRQKYTDPPLAYQSGTEPHAYKSKNTSTYIDLVPAPVMDTKLPERKPEKSSGVLPIIIDSKTHQVHNIADSLPDKEVATSFRSDRLHKFHIALNHLQAGTIRSTLKVHQNPKAGKRTEDLMT